MRGKKASRQRQTATAETLARSAAIERERRDIAFELSLMRLGLSADDAMRKADLLRREQQAAEEARALDNRLDQLPSTLP